MTAPLAVTAHPNMTSLPGSNVLQQLVNGAEAWALAAALLGAFIGAALWAVASLVVGAAPGLVNFFEHLGTTAH